ncbi:MAG: class I SAM-dependent methyltransferase [Candidatus Peregrinibacteria bacterium]|nr:class I SAM-dependent methyltransferase [Candidatus Peregrinibacteria bacterium]
MKDAYFYVQAEVGVTKHGGGLKATKELVKRCHIDKRSYVLVVGCGPGITAAKIAKICECKVMGVDLSPSMIKAAQREIKKGLNLSFEVGDAQKLPFKANTFDAVISESVTAFPPDKQKAIKEYYRVLKPGGYMGLNETTWLSKPLKKYLDYCSNVIGGVKPEFKKDWEGHIEQAGFKLVFSRAQKFKIIEQIIGEMRATEFTRNIMALYRMAMLYPTNKKFRKAVNQLTKDAFRYPRGLMKSLGWGIYVGRK